MALRSHRSNVLPFNNLDSQSSHDEDAVNTLDDDAVKPRIGPLSGPLAEALGAILQSHTVSPVTTPPLAENVHPPMPTGAVSWSMPQPLPSVGPPPSPPTAPRRLVSRRQSTISHTPISMVDVDDSTANPVPYSLLHEVIVNRDLYTADDKAHTVKVYDYPSTIKNALSRVVYTVADPSHRPTQSLLLVCAIHHGLDVLELDNVTESMDDFRARLCGPSSGWLPERYYQQFATWIDNLPIRPESYGDRTSILQLRLPEGIYNRVCKLAGVLGTPLSTIVIVSAMAGLASQDNLREYVDMFSSAVSRFRSLVRVRLAMYRAMLTALESEYNSR